MAVKVLFGVWRVYSSVEGIVAYNSIICSERQWKLCESSVAKAEGVFGGSGT